MKLYYIFGEHRYVHRQSDIPKGAPHDVRDIPTDLSGLMGFLNNWEADRELEREHWRSRSGTSEPETAPPPAKVPDREQSSVLRDCDIEDHIHNANPQRLAVLSAAVCWRIKELTNGCNLARGAEAPTGQPAAQGPNGEPLAEA